MNTGVEILLKRMETNPEDFDYQPHTGGMSRWMRLVDHAIADEIVTQEEKDALNAGMKEVKRIRFTELVMKELAGVDQKEYETEIGNSAFSSMADAQRYQSEMMRRQLDAQRITLKREELNSVSAQDKAKLLAILDEQRNAGKKKAKSRWALSLSILRPITTRTSPCVNSRPKNTSGTSALTRSVLD